MLEANVAEKGLSEDWKPVKKMNFANLYTAKLAIKYLEKDFAERGLRVKTDPMTGKPDVRRPNLDIGNISDYLEDIRDILDITKTRKGLSQVLNAYLDKVEQRSLEGIIPQSMERTMNLGGHSIERLMENPQSLSAKSLDYLANLQPHIWEKAANFYGQSSFAAEVLRPILESDILRASPNLKKAIENVGQNVIGKGNNIFHGIDRVVKQYLVKAGLNPTLAKSIGDFLTLTFSLPVLMANVAFYTVNAVQALDGISTLLRAQGDIKAQNKRSGTNLPVGSITKAIADTNREISTGQYRSKNNEVRNQIVASGKADPVQASLLGTDRIFDPFAKMIEHENRLVSASLTYNYFKQIMPHEKAMEAAISGTDMTMVPYSGPLGRPLALQMLGDMLRPMTVFATYMMHDLGRLASDIKRIQQDPTMASAYAPLIAFQAVKYGLFGITGLSLVQNWDDITKWLNKLLPEMRGIPGPMEWVRSWENKDLRAHAEFGAISQTAGVDIKGSAGAAINAPFKGLLEYQSAMASLQLLIEKFALSHINMPFNTEGRPLVNPPSRQDLLEAGQHMPKFAKYPFEKALQSGNVDEFITRMTDAFTMNPNPKYKDFALQGNSMGAFYKRSPKESLENLFTVQSLEESSARTTQRIFKSKELTLKGELANYYERLKEDVSRNNLTDQEKSYMIGRIGQSTGKSGDEITQLLKDGVKQENLTTKQRLMIEQGNEAALKKKRFLDIEAQQPYRR